MKFRLLLLGFFIFFIVSYSFAQSVEQFTQYDVTYTILEDGIIEVNKTMSLRNIHSVGIVPGPVDFRISVLEGNDLEIFDLRATNRHGELINSNILEIFPYKIIRVNVFTPILPGFEYQINLNYKLELQNSSGLLFKRIQLPLAQDTRVPILDGRVTINVPQSHFLTHSSYRDNSTLLSSNSVTFDINEQTPEYVLIEFSRIPSRIGPIAGSLVFWIMINIILFSILIIEITRGFKKREK